MPRSTWLTHRSPVALLHLESRVSELPWADSFDVFTVSLLFGAPVAALANSIFSGWQSH
jgi:hypothetical protein